MKEKKTKWVVILLILILMTVVADIVIRLSVQVQAKPELSPQYSKMLIKIGMEDPDCANKLLKEANLTNIHIVPPGTLNARRSRESSRSQNS